MVQRIYTDPHSPDVFRIKVSINPSAFEVEMWLLTNICRGLPPIPANLGKRLIVLSRHLHASYGKACIYMLKDESSSLSEFKVLHMAWEVRRYKSLC